MNPLPPDPYLVLGVSKTAQIAEIRSAHRKRVLKCHPDKVQDEALKAEKQDEFQKVQQAYELLSDEMKRTQYDQQVKLYELRKEMGRGVPSGGPGANIYSAEPRFTSASYRPKQPPPPQQMYPSRYKSDEPKHSTPRRSGSYETAKPKSSSKDDERRAKKKEDERYQKEPREAVFRERESKREKEAHAEPKKRRDKDRRKDSEDKPTKAYIESESDSEELRTTSQPPPTRLKVADVFAMPAAQRARDEGRRGSEIVDAAERRREKTKMAFGNAYRYIKTVQKGAELRVNIPIVPEPPTISTIVEEDEVVRRSSRRSSRRTSAETPTSSSRRAQNSSRSRESPRLSSKDKKRSDPRMEEEVHTRPKPTLFTQKSAPPEVREKLSRSNTMDDKYGSKGTFGPAGFARASTFHGTEKVQPRSSSYRNSKYEMDSESESDSDSPLPPKQPSPVRERPERPAGVKSTSSYKIVRDLNGQRAERIHDLNEISEEPRDRSPSHTTNAYPRAAESLRPSSHRATQSYSQPIPVREREREPPRVTTVHPSRPPARGAQTQYSSSRQLPSVYDEVKVAFAPKIGQEDIAYAQDFTTRRGSDSERYANYPAPNQNYRREEFAPSRKTAYVG